MEREIIADIDAGRVTDYSQLARELVASPLMLERPHMLLFAVARWGEDDPTAALDFCSRYVTDDGTVPGRPSESERRSNVRGALYLAAFSIIGRWTTRDEVTARRALAAHDSWQWLATLSEFRLIDHEPKPYLATGGQMQLATAAAGHAYPSALGQETVSQEEYLRAAKIRPEWGPSLLKEAIVDLGHDGRLSAKEVVDQVAKSWPTESVRELLHFDPTTEVRVTSEALRILLGRFAGGPPHGSDWAKLYPEAHAGLTQAEQLIASGTTGREVWAAAHSADLRSRFAAAASPSEQLTIMKQSDGRLAAIAGSLAQRLAASGAAPEQVTVFEILRTPATEAEPAFGAFSQLPTQTQARWRLDVAASFSTDAPALAASALAAATPEELARPETAWMFSRVASSFVEADSVAASAWLGALPPGPARDAGVLAMLRATAAENPNTAAQWAATLQSDEARAQAADLLTSNPNAPR